MGVADGAHRDAAGRLMRAGLLGGGYLRFEFDTQRLRDARTVRRICFGAVGNMALLDLNSGITHGAGGIFEQNLLLGGAHLPKQIAGLLIVIVVDSMVPIGRITLDRKRRFDQRLFVVDLGALAVGPVARCRAEIAVGSHLAVAMIADERAFRRVHGDMVEVDPESIALRVAIGK